MPEKARSHTILFHHHRNDAVTRLRYENLVRRNPGVPIVKTTYGSTDVLPDTYDVASIPYWAGQDGWYNGDLALYVWFRKWRTPGTTAERYIYVEYDMIYRTPMHEFYREVWDEDVAGATLFLRGPHPEWHWFNKKFEKLPKVLVPFAAGISPLAGTMISHRALEKICAHRIPRGVFCELRLATLANYHGFDIAEFPWRKKRNITWREEFVRFEKETEVYHPVKGIHRRDAGE